MTDEGLDRLAAEKGERFIRGLREMDSPHVREARGKGLMVGLELKTKAGPFLTSLLDRGIAAVPTGATIIRFLPPLVISDEEVGLALSIISEVLDGRRC
jgi:acetylornithine/LysW-gamma-L-lysine aminotransferase